MNKLHFPNGIDEFDYEKYGVYIPFMYHTVNILSELYGKWDEESRIEDRDNRYERDFIEEVVNKNTGQKGKVRESIKRYLSKLMWNEYPLNSFVYNLSEMYMDLGWIIDELSKDDEVIIGKYKIEHHNGFFGYWKDKDGNYDWDIMLEEEFKLYCNDELYTTVYNGGGFQKCLELIIEHAGGFESWKMLNEVN